jgi:hypothetical protein
MRRIALASLFVALAAAPANSQNPKGMRVVGYAVHGEQRAAAVSR